MFSLACHSFALSDCCHWAPFEFNACCQRALLLCGGKQGYAEAVCMYAYLKHPLWGQILNCLLSQRKLVIHNVRWRLCQCLMILSNSEMSARVAEQMQTLMSVFLSGKKNRKKEIVRANLNLMYSFYKIHTHTHTHTHRHTHTHSPSKSTLYAFIHCRQNIGSCKISPSCPCGGLNWQPWGSVSIQAKLPRQDGPEKGRGVDEQREERKSGEYPDGRSSAAMVDDDEGQ